MSNSVPPYELQPARLQCPRDSPGKNTGVSCPFPEDLPDPGVKPVSTASQANSSPTELSVNLPSTVIKIKF